MHSRNFARRRIRRIRPRLRSAVCVPDGMNNTTRVTLFVGIGIFILALIGASIYVKRVSTQIALSDARDVITAKVNDAVLQTLSEGEYDGDYFVTFQKDEDDAITAVSCNMAHINMLTSRVLEKVIGKTQENTITIGIPVGNLTGIPFLMGRGVKLPVKITVLSSSRAEFANSVVAAGINQTKHQIDLCVAVDMRLMLPWGSESDTVSTEILIADTVIVGKVPDTYLNMQ